MVKKHVGRCACNAIEFGFDSQPSFLAVCHCLDCKRASGGEAAMFMNVPNENFKLTRGTPKGFGYVADSGKKLERAFCPECGSRLYTRNLEAFPGMVFVQVGALDDASDLPPALEMFTKRRLAWSSPLPLPQFTDMPH